MTTGLIEATNRTGWKNQRAPTSAKFLMMNILYTGLEVLNIWYLRYLPVGIHGRCREKGERERERERGIGGWLLSYGEYPVLTYEITPPFPRSTN